MASPVAAAPTVERKSSSSVQRCASNRTTSFFGPTVQACDCPECRARRLQRAPLVGSPDDPLEAEAERLAQAVTRQGAGAAGAEAPPSADSGETAPSSGRPGTIEASDSADEPVARLAAETGDPPQQEDVPSTVRNDSIGPEALLFPDGDAGPSDASDNSIDIRSQLNARAGHGEPLPGDLLAFFEVRFDRSLAHVRIHTDRDAERIALALQARAFAYGQDIYFAADRYQPQSPEGRELIAHELVHTMQQAGSVDEPTVRRDGEIDNIRKPPESRISVRLDALIFTPVHGRWSDGPRLHQVYAVILRRLLGSGYRPEMVQAFLDWWPKAPRSAATGMSGPLAEMGEAPMEAFWARESVPYKLMVFAAKHSGSATSLQLTSEQMRIIRLGHAAEFAWYAIQKLVMAKRVKALPNWVNQPLFTALVGSRAGLLEDFDKASTALDDDKSPDRQQAVDGLAMEMVESIAVQTDVVEAIRVDPKLINLPAYKMIWPPRALSPNEEMRDRLKRDRTEIASDAAEEASPDWVFRFTEYVRSQPSLAEVIMSSNRVAAVAARRTLLTGFDTFNRQGLGANNGDQKLTDNPGRLATAQAHPASLSVYPPVEQPFFDSATGTEQHFTMSLQFPTVFDAFQSFSYRFEFFRIKDSEIIGAAKKSSQAKQVDAPADDEPPAAAPEAEPPRPAPSTSGGRIDATPEGTERLERPTGMVLRNSLRRDERYLRADVRAVIESMRTQIGSPGTSLGLIAINGVLRFAATLVRTFLTTLFKPRHVQDYVFEDEGFYVVRAIAYPHNRDDAAIKRAPSVAYLPIWARHPEIMAESRVQSQLSRQERAGDRRTEIEQKLQDTSLSAEDRKKLEDELTEIKFSQGDVGQQLAHSYWELEKEIKKLRAEILGNVPADSAAGRSLLHVHTEYQGLLKQQKAIKDLWYLQKARSLLTKSERLTASFVSYKGQAVNLLLEATNITPRGETGSQTWYVSDLTTPKSGDGRGTGATKAEAIRRALRSFLQSGAGYGRGRLSVVIDGQAFPEEVDANSDELLVEALENVATIASIAAIAAAPFTGGSSLYLLIPIGLIGAIPSAYRIMQRVDNKTFQIDEQVAMDIVNIISSVVAIGQIGAGVRAASIAARTGSNAAFKTLSLNGALMMTGFGLDGLNGIMMGAGIMEQLDATAELPDGLRQAQIAEIVGNAMLQAGIMAGGTLASHLYQGKIQGGIEQSESNFGRWFVGLEEPTRQRLEGDRNLRETFASMRPDIRELMTRCGSWCIPIDHPPDKALQKQLEKLVDKLQPTADDRRILQTYFHDRRDDLGKAIGDLEGHKSLKSLRATLADLVSPANAVLLSFSVNSPKARGEVAVGLINRILEIPAAKGKKKAIGVAQLGDIVDKAHQKGHNGEKLISLLRGIEQMVAHYPPGTADVLDELAGNGNRFNGAEFTVRYITDRGLWGQVSALEFSNFQGTRRWDARINNALIQFKSWKVFWTDTFLKQFARDYEETAGFAEGSLHWVFDNRHPIVSKEQVEGFMVKAIQDAHARQPARPPYNERVVVWTMIDAIRSGRIVKMY